MAHVNFEQQFLRTCQKIITKHRKYLNRHPDQVGGNVVVIPCAGGCGKTVRVRLKNIGPGNILVCNDRDTRDQCHRNIPKAVHGLTAVKFPQSAGHFMGIQYQDLGRWSAFKAACRDVVGSIISSASALGMRKD